MGHEKPQYLESANPLRTIAPLQVILTSVPKSAVISACVPRLSAPPPPCWLAGWLAGPFTANQAMKIILQLHPSSAAIRDPVRPPPPPPPPPPPLKAITSLASQHDSPGPILRLSL
ncbi:hypothetical protein ACRE_090800 [Hapsidospora chrysogenum ATCC 11550]|uniref:Uncharacterized protein n=1 Tax=Hapsidospora chrysogenum (strain ATCC 11550 / CBS 779.69 / DSM 880 / IAM 14645 / JCM 23072 / IMI 49137) TaxID=857340 RepID=A0A086ST30_HAPC1|nr:hypothetical protein ACRE_090800 [Hapsidospora chrysogenum ATCC 11550]